jgi:hypothetical protein
MGHFSGQCSVAKAYGCASFCFRGFFFAVFGRRGCFERVEKTEGDPGDFVDGFEENGLVCFGWFGETADLSHELKGGGSHLLFGDGRIEVKQGFYVPAHTGMTSSYHRGREELVRHALKFSLPLWPGTAQPEGGVRTGIDSAARGARHNVVQHGQMVRYIAAWRFRVMELITDGHSIHMTPVSRGAAYDLVATNRGPKFTKNGCSPRCGSKFA